MSLRTLSLALACAAAAPAAAARIAPAQAPARLRLQVAEGRNVNVLARDGLSAAHLVLRNGTDPRLLVAFPAGNSGVGAWFARAAAPVSWRMASSISTVSLTDSGGRPLRGVTAEVEVDAPKLVVDRVVVGSVRVLRDYEALHAAPAQLDVKPQREGAGLTWARRRLDGAPGYYLSITPLNGDLAEGVHPFWTSRGGPLRLRVVAATGEPPLTPIDQGEALTASAGGDARARASLAFLSYREKLLAGSWRFLTYFGRDTLMSVRLLLPVLRPEEAEAGLGAVLERLSPTGEVAHEESIGEFAVMENLKAGRGPVDTPVYDYKMIDGDYLLAPVLQAYAERYGRARLRAFLQRRAPGGRRYADLLARNLRHVVDAARPFAARPGADTLIHLKPGVPVGEWRDSDTGLAGGRTPYDVNAVFVPAALDAAADLVRDGGLDAAIGAPSADEAARLAQAWRAEAPGFFAAEIPPEAARRAVAAFAREQGVEAAPALASLPVGPLRFEALSLDGAGRPIPVLNSDVGFALLFGRPAPEALARMVSGVMRPFPAGLMTDVGPVVADAAYAPAEVRRAFGRTAYHGAVVWAWQEAVLIAGLDRQLARTDLPAAMRADLARARTRLFEAVRAVGDTRTSELWSWAYAGGRYRAQAFGAAAGDADESNAAQLWSTVFLALDRAPRGRPVTALAQEGVLTDAAEGASSWRVVVALVATYVLYAVLLNSVGTVILQAVRVFGIGKGQASLLEGCKDLSIAGVSFLLASSLPAIGYRRALIAGLLALAAACAAMPLLDSFWMTAVAFVVTGATFGLAKVAVYGAIGLVAADPRRHASLTSLVEGLFMAGVVGGYWLFAAFIPPEGATGAGWLDVYWVLAAASVAVAGLWLATALDERRLRARAGASGASFAAMLALLLRPFVGVFLLCAFLYVLIEQSLGTWMPTFNHEVLRLSPQLSVQLASVYAGSLCLGRLGGSAVLRRFSRFAVLGACVVGMAALLVLALVATRGLGGEGVEGWRELPPQALILPAIGLLMSVIYPTLNSVVLSALPVERQAGMTGLIVVFSALGGTLGSFVTGRAFAAFGGRDAVAGVLIPIALLFGALVVLARLTRRADAVAAAS